MSNFSIAEDTPAHKYEVEDTVDAIVASETSQARIKSWYIDILVVIIGLLALFFFLSLGNVFAIAGPWVIYLGVLSNRKRAGLGKQLLCIITGASLLCLSLAVLLLPGHGRPWYVIGGVLGLLGGSGYMMATIFYYTQNG